MEIRYRRLAADRVDGAADARFGAMTWTEIGRRAVAEGVLDWEQARLLAGGQTRPR